MNTNSIIIGLIVIVLLAAGWVFYFRSPAEPPAPPGAELPNAPELTEQIKEFTIRGNNFVFSPAELRVKKGDRVKINFRSEDGFHDWTLNEFDARVSRVNTGGISSVEFTADKTGEFEFHCSVGNHRDLGMHGKLIVEE